MAFPKNQAARDVMSDAPRQDPEQLAELGLRVVEPPKIAPVTIAGPG
jgi:aspartyl-tRNA synthetase